MPAVSTKSTCMIVWFACLSLMRQFVSIGFFKNLDLNLVDSEFAAQVCDNSVHRKRNFCVTLVNKLRI